MLDGKLYGALPKRLIRKNKKIIFPSYFPRLNIENRGDFTLATKYIFVTGGGTSSMGKGIVAASLGRLLKNRGLKVTVQKFDPYLNIDPGTMSPYQHGEAFVTADGAETDLDLGHYERFIDINLNQS